MKKKLLATSSMIAATILIGYLFVISLVVGFIASKWGAGKSAGEQGRVKSIIIPFWKWRIHLHHWLVSVGLIGVSTTYGYHLLTPQITYGLLGGLAFQGIYCYSDWYRIIVRKNTFMPSRKRLRPPRPTHNYYLD